MTENNQIKLGKTLWAIADQLRTVVHLDNRFGLPAQLDHLLVLGGPRCACSLGLLSGRDFGEGCLRGPAAEAGNGKRMPPKRQR